MSSVNKVLSDVLAPGATETWNYEIFQHATDDKRDQSRSYILVRIRYVDVFSKSDRTTNLCFMETILGTVEHCPTRNSMD